MAVNCSPISFFLGSIRLKQTPFISTFPCEKVTTVFFPAQLLAVLPSRGFVLNLNSVGAVAVSVRISPSAPSPTGCSFCSRCQNDDDKKDDKDTDESRVSPPGSLSTHAGALGDWGTKVGLLL